MNQSKAASNSVRPNWRSTLYTPPFTRIVQFALSLAIVVASVVPLARFLGVALQRVGYPYPVEFCEGGTIGHMRMVLSGHQGYHAPSLDFTPHLYPPLYYYVSAVVALFVGAGHLAPRIVSLVSILGCFVLLGRWVRDETDDPIAGVASVGLLASTYQITGFWFEVARVDSFFLVLVLSSHLLSRSAKTPRQAALVGVLIAAACFTKQLGLPLAVPPIVLLGLRSFRLGAVAAVVSGVIVVVAATAFNFASHGWFLYYVLDLPSRHPVQWERFWPSVQQFFLGTTFPMSLAAVAMMCGVGFARLSWRNWVFNALFVSLAVSTSFLPFLKSGGYPNGLIPAYTALALASGLVLGALRSSRISGLGKLGPQLAACAVLAIQFAVLDYDPKPAVPTTADLEANREVVTRLSRLEKPLFVTGSSYYTMAAGGQPIMSDTMGMVDVFKGGGPQAAELQKSLAAAFHQHRFKSIVMDRAAGFLPGQVTELINQEYVPRGSVLHGIPGDVMWPRSGAGLRPEQIWEPR